MLRSLDSVLASSIIATDGEIGKAYNILFDDRSWAVRYLVVETGSWFTRRKVLLSPAVLGRPDENTIQVLLTREQVQSSPDVEADQPVSRQQEIAMVRHCRWTTRNLEPSSPSYVSTDASVPESQAALEEAGDPHLRSAKEVAGYRVDASDGPLGHITDFIIDDEGWGILDLVVNVELLSEGHKALVPTQWVSSVSWELWCVQLSHLREDSVTADFWTEA
jgi:uncharacterized protein YrrD